MSTEDKKQGATEFEHEVALKVYIDALLLEPDEIEASPEQVVPIAEPVEAITATELKVEAKLEATVVETRVADKAIPANVSPVPASSETVEYLLFKVAGFLTLSVPLARLNGIVKWSGEITPIPGHADWFLGLISNRGRQVKVIDIAKFVIPENHKSRQAVEAKREFKHLLLVGGGRYGLACDELGQVLKLTSEKIRWRDDRSRRPWLAGTIIEQMSALLDVDSFIEMLKDGVLLDEVP
ncbi:MAG TPA: chemotaxis protein CheW [Candidatus Tenderia electrophaga]|uniref:Chemotaxis protein CheW n=1 Tax=Candidatus Tenderia electrophaga TaxID=1748243 RepID=A0A832N695_9GAMM|nr:chemotaxis protein CheW [Candidatus Tenderia electrophaga]